VSKFDTLWVNMKTVALVVFLQSIKI